MASVSPEQLLGRLAKGKPVPGILLLGDESYLRELWSAENFRCVCAGGSPRLGNYAIFG